MSIPCIESPQLCFVNFSTVLTSTWNALPPLQVESPLYFLFWYSHKESAFCLGCTWSKLLKREAGATDKLEVQTKLYLLVWATSVKCEWIHVIKLTLTVVLHVATRWLWFLRNKYKTVMSKAFTENRNRCTDTTGCVVVTALGNYEVLSNFCVWNKKKSGVHALSKCVLYRWFWCLCIADASTLLQCPSYGTYQEVIFFPVFR
jgi:hypothetical protein